ncbi:MAG TPA: cytochrome c [Chromatiales bacterium]|nr:cytochrome c [Chromatiales bacterium]HDO73948.1 cytochrome c [Chromatiales bacterium]HEX23021.1 cytochrome c [Chromatiales bacterium]HEX23130.1 cytochrome c [Chromatiales bacterium]
MKRSSVVTIAILSYGLATAALAAGDILAGKTKSAACIACHGKWGISSTPDYPNIAGQTELYLVKSLREFRSGLRKDPSMNRLAEGLSDTDIADLSAYYASLRR